MIRSQDNQDVETLRQAVVAIARNEPILRVKGFANTGTGRMLIQAVRTRVEAKVEPDAPPVRQAELVFIGYHPSRQRLVEQLGQLTGTAWR